MSVKPLKIWNGGWHFGRPVDRSRDARLWDGLRHNQTPTVYVAAYSRADAIRLIAEYLGGTRAGLANAVRRNWTEGRWGLAMDGVTPERGIWIQVSFDAVPVRLV